MIKFKNILLLLAVIAGAATATAQHAPGSWKILPMSGHDFQTVRDTPEKVYYLTGNSLYAYDKEAGETTYFSPGQKLSDSGISNLYYNNKGGYLLCAYTNGNIDLIYDSGKVVNLPEIKDATLSVAKSINDVSFADGRIYIATSFGIVIYDDKKHSVIESGIYNESVRNILEVGDNILINNQNGYLAYSPKSDRHNAVTKFKEIQSVGIDEWFALDGNSYICRLGDNIWKVTLFLENPSASFGKLAEVAGAKELYPTKTGFAVAGTSSLVQFDATGAVIGTTALPEGYSGQILSMWNSPKSVWAADGDGIGQVDLTSGTILSQKYFPESSKQTNAVYAVNSHDQSKVFFNGKGWSEWLPQGDPGWGLHYPFIFESYDWNTGELTDMSPVVTKQYSNESQAEQNKFKLDMLFGGPCRTFQDPVDPDLFYHANEFEGLFVIKNRKILYHFDKKNSPLAAEWGTRVFEMAYDNNGNLWFGLFRGTKQLPTSTPYPFKVLRSESVELLRTNPAALEEKDADGQYKHWMQPVWPSTDTGKTDIALLFSSKSNKGIRIGGQYGGPIIGLDTKGTSNVADDKYTVYTSFADQDGNVVSNPTYKTCLVEDRNGDIWIGTTVGPLVIKDMNQIADGSSTILNVVRPKVARNDGTNYADFLLSSDQIYAIAVDVNNHKWIGTQNSGLFHVNEDGTVIIEEFNKDNSPLVSNTVTMIACNPNGNDILIGTPEGQFVYSSDSAPAADDYSEVYAFPNPVRPDYNGWITINGLMDNSLIKIADVQGHVIWSGRSEGGMAMWDGCDSAGNRVRSGVYMVYASQNADGNSKGAVTKIVVVN